jgi:hypothetical protein
MARYSKQSQLQPDEVLKRAVDFFGTGGLGLQVAEQTEGCLSLEGGGGHVTVTAARCEPEYTDVDLETREWDYQVQQFMEKL